MKQAMMTDKIWFPAINVAAHFEADFLNISAPKKVEEMMAVAIAMAGMQEIHKKQYWIQGVSDEEESPDVRTMCCDEPNGDRASMCYQQDVEVVSYTKHSASESLEKFLKKTKFSPESAYDNLTTILINVKARARLPSANEWSSALALTGKQNPVLVLGKIHQDQPLYSLAFVHPIVEGAVDYDPYQLLKKQGYSKVIKWGRGTKHKDSIDMNESHCPFEKFWVKCKLIK